MNPSTRLLPSGRGNNIHLYKKHRRVDSIHFTMSSSTKTTQPRDPAKSSHFRRKMAQHKRDGAASTTSESYSLSTRELKNDSGRPGIDRKNCKLEVKTCVSGWQAQASPAKTMSLTKWSSKISSVTDPVKPTNLATNQRKVELDQDVSRHHRRESALVRALNAIEHEILSLAGPAKTMSLTK